MIYIYMALAKVEPDCVCVCLPLRTFFSMCRLRLLLGRDQSLRADDPSQGGSRRFFFFFIYCNTNYVLYILLPVQAPSPN